ncbi:MULTISPECIES: hypothetical protein [unclassified Lactobacillus]|nr:MULTISPECIES: hypothetical protein [unclassified Lactobacillus]
MTKLNDDYILGLDIGTNSCGWAASEYQVLDGGQRILKELNSQ